MQAQIMIVDDDTHMRSALALSLKKINKEGKIFSSAEEALAFVEKNPASGKEPPFFLIISDLNLPGMDGTAFLGEIKKTEGYKNIPFVIITGYGTIESAVTAMKFGAVDYLLKPFDITDFERVIKNAEKISYIGAKETKTVKPISSASGDEKSDFIYRSDKMKQIDLFIGLTAATDATVLITGESGTGKEVVARRIHELSKRKGRFVGVNCSAIVDTLLESELFGHEKGAFTGASARKIGKFETANKGTILLDEIADMDNKLQSKILRTLQERVIDRVGGDEPVPVDVRVVAATNRDIKKMISEGSFREDLYYRINVIPVHLPPLRERKEDIPALAEYFMKKYSKKYFRNCSEITKDALDYLLSLNYPGNIRELENIIERAVILSQGKEVLDSGAFSRFDGGVTANLDILQSETAQNEEKQPAAGREEVDAGSLNIRDMEERLILAALKDTGGNRTKAAEKLGITSRTLRNKLKEFSLKP